MLDGAQDYGDDADRWLELHGLAGGDAWPADGLTSLSVTELGLAYMLVMVTCQLAAEVLQRLGLLGGLGLTLLRVVPVIPLAVASAAGMLLAVGYGLVEGCRAFRQRLGGGPPLGGRLG